LVVAQAAQKKELAVGVDGMAWVSAETTHAIGLYFNCPLIASTGRLAVPMVA